MKRLMIAAIAAGVLAAAPALAHDYKLGNLEIAHPWSRATAPAAANGAAYMVLTANGKDTDRLVSAASPAAEKVELHTHLMEDGVMKMRPVAGIEVTPGSPTALQPGGLHIMLLGLKHPLTKGKSFPLTLTFEKAGSVTVEVAVDAAGASAGGHNKH